MKVFTCSDKGRVRQSNQDSCYAGLLPGGGAWAAVFDGMGGANGGDYASQNAISIVRDRLERGYHPALSSENLEYLIADSVLSANSFIYGQSRSNVSLSGMGTTVVIAVARGNTVMTAHAGDSRAYLLSPRGSRQLTTDHSMVQEMVDCGRLTAEQAVSHPRKNVITRALGVRDTLEIDFSEYKVNPGDVILLCSDGLSNYLTLQELETAAAAFPRGELASRLVAAANDRGGADNITVAVIYIDQ